MHAAVKSRQKYRCTVCVFLVRALPCRGRECICRIACTRAPGAWSPLWLDTLVMRLIGKLIVGLIVKLILGLIMKLILGLNVGLIVRLMGGWE